MNGKDSPNQVGPSEYLLFAGSSPEPIDGRKALVASFVDERQARAAFVDWRVRTTSPEAWARLVTVDEARRVDVLCWFGPEVRLAPDLLARKSKAPRPLQPLPVTRRTAMSRNGTTTISDEEPAVNGAPAEQSPLRRSHSGPRGRAWIWAALAAIVIGAVSGVLAGGGRSPSRPVERTSAYEAVQALLGHEILRTQTVTYGAHTSTRWGTDAGLHQVTVMAGTMTIDGSNGETSRYGPGATYVAGWTPYVVRNETPEPVEALVSYLRAQEATMGPTP
jgi:hypothetical protein